MLLPYWKKTSDFALGKQEFGSVSLLAGLFWRLMKTSRRLVRYSDSLYEKVDGFQPAFPKDEKAAGLTTNQSIYFKLVLM